MTYANAALQVSASLSEYGIIIMTKKDRLLVRAGDPLPRHLCGNSSLA